MIPSESRVSRIQTRGDMTSELLFDHDSMSRATIISREEIIVCGMDIAREILTRYDEKLKLKIRINDGEPAHVGSRLGVIEGPLRSMLSAERVMLNFLQRLSGIATTTKRIRKMILLSRWFMTSQKLRLGPSATPDLPDSGPTPGSVRG